MQYRIKKRLESLGFVVYLVNPNPEKGAEVSLGTRCSRANTYWKNQGKPSNCLFTSMIRLFISISRRVKPHNSEMRSPVLKRINIPL